MEIVKVNKSKGMYKGVTKRRRMGNSISQIYSTKVTFELGQSELMIFTGFRTNSPLFNEELTEYDIVNENQNEWMIKNDIGNVSEYIKKNMLSDDYNGTHKFLNGTYEFFIVGKKTMEEEVN